MKFSLPTTLTLLTICAMMNNVCAMEESQLRQLHPNPFNPSQTSLSQSRLSLSSSDLSSSGGISSSLSSSDLSSSDLSSSSESVDEDSVLSNSHNSIPLSPPASRKYFKHYNNRVNRLNGHVNNNRNEAYATREQFKYNVMALMRSAVDRLFDSQMVAYKFKYWAPPNIGKEYNKIRASQVKEKKDCDTRALREAAFYDVIAFYVKSILSKARSWSFQRITVAGWHKDRLKLMAAEVKLQYLTYVISTFAGKNTAAKSQPREVGGQEHVDYHFKSTLQYNNIAADGHITGMISIKKSEIEVEVARIARLTMAMDIKLKTTKKPNDKFRKTLKELYWSYVGSADHGIAMIKGELENLSVTLDSHGNDIDARFCNFDPEDGDIVNRSPKDDTGLWGSMASQAKSAWATRPEWMRRKNANSRLE